MAKPLSSSTPHGEYTSPLPKSVQFLDSHSADFEALTWSFQITGSEWVSAGRFAVLSYEDFTKVHARLRHAEKVLHELLVVGPVSPKHKEMLEKFFDPEPL